MDLRERVIRAYDQKAGTQEQIAKLFGVSARWIKKLLQRRRESGQIVPKPHGGGWTPKFCGPKLDQLKAWVEQDSDVTLQELLDRSGVDGSIMAVHRALERLGCSRKKRRSTPPSKIGPT